MKVAQTSHNWCSAEAQCVVALVVIPDNFNQMPAQTV